MKVLILCDRYLPVSEQFIWYQIQALKEHDLYLFCRKRDKNKREDSFFAKQCFWYDHLIFRLRYKLLGGAEQYPVFVQHFLHSFIKENQIDLIYIHYGTTAVKYEDLLSTLNLPIICAFHGFDASRKLENSFYKSSIKRLSHRFSSITVPSQYLKEKLVAAGLRAESIVVLPYGTDIDKITAIAPERISEKLTIVHAGRIVPKKGVTDLIKVFIQLSKAHNDVQLLVIGGGEEEKEAVQLARESLFSSRIHFTGQLQHDHLIRLLKGADIFVLNSRTSDNGETEGLPNSIIEAMAAGVPVISTRHSGISEMIEDGVNGLLVTPKSNKELFAALDKMIKDKDLRNYLTTNARLYVRENLSLSGMAVRIQSLVNSL